MNNINPISLCIVLICVISIALYIYKKKDATEPFYQSSDANPISIIDTATSVMKENPFLDSVDTSKQPSASSLLRYNGNTQKWEPYEFSRFVYSITSKLNITSTPVNLLSKAAYANTTHYDTVHVNNITGGKISFITLNNGGNGIITVDPNCRYKVTLNATMYIHTISAAANIIIELYGSDANNANSELIGKCSTYIYSTSYQKHICMSVIGFIDNKNNNKNYSNITPMIRFEHATPTTAITYTGSTRQAPDATINIAIEEY